MMACCKLFLSQGLIGLGGERGEGGGVSFFLFFPHPAINHLTHCNQKLQPTFLLPNPLSFLLSLFLSPSSPSTPLPTLGERKEGRGGRQMSFKAHNFIRDSFCSPIPFTRTFSSVQFDRVGRRPELEGCKSQGPIPSEPSSSLCFWRFHQTKGPPGV
ncbi:hypothetical protein IE53DRAFT_15317 [Violaceomyces palustris]|uniref:Uncharacterized protein n=1 Tax=Violaceomyces palustris TaxID=1673888 RepID=A0ACD0P230_9BASI|nr:hypothetical protein IE53DRAFT_15317 [Violaceomyces palustris]